MTNWSGMMERAGWATEQVGSEPFTPLSGLVAGCRQRGEAVAKVTTTVGTAQDFGVLKVSFTVSVECPQTEAAINLAGEAAYRKAVELVNDAAEHVGLPGLPELPA